MLSNNEFQEAVTKVFKLKEDCPRTVADVILYAYADEIVVDPNKNREIEDYIALIKAYILADKWNIESVCNKLAVYILRLNYHGTTTPMAILYFIEAGLEESLLYKTLFEQAAWNLAIGKYTTKEAKEHLEGRVQQLLTSYHMELFEAVRMAVVRHFNGPIWNAL